MRRPRVHGTVAACAALLVGALVLTTCSDGGGSDGGAAPDPTGTEQEVESADGLVFTEVGEDAGLTESQSDLDLTGEAAMTSGAAVADVDGDGDLDIFLPRVGKQNGLYLNDGDGSFTDVAREAGVAGTVQRHGSAAGTFFDAESDGDLDLFVVGSGKGANELFINDGSGKFTDEAADRGLDWPAVTAEQGSQHHGVSVADVDRDGDLDLLVLQWYSQIYNGEAVAAAAKAAGRSKSEAPGPCETAAALADIGFPVPAGTERTRSRLLLNDGSGSFSDATEQFGLPLGQIVAFTGVFNDVDGDGFQDLAITGDGCTSRLFRNIDGQRFEDITEAAGVGTDENGMGSVIRDVDGDGTPDWFVTSISRSGEECQGGGFFGCSGNRLFLGNGDSTFVDATDQFGLRDGAWGWGAAIEDFANDGTLQVVMANGYDVAEAGDENSFHAPFLEDTTRFWRRDGDSYRDVAEDVGIEDTTVGHAVVPFDMDGDGDLDLLVVPSKDRPRLYRNDSNSGNAWLSISLDDSTNPGNRWGDGARVEVTAEAGGDPVVGWITTSGSYESQKPPEFHVGLGDHDGSVAQVDVYWPGDTDPQTLTGVEADQRLVVRRS